MSNSAIETVKAFFRSLVSRDADLATRYVHPNRYVEHNHRAAYSIAGLRTYVGTLPEDSQLELVRAFQDGDFIVTHQQGRIAGQNVFFDVFRLEDNLIVEHWGFSTAGAPPNESGHTQVDGPTEPWQQADTEKNKAVVREYYETVHIAGRHDQIRRFMSGELQIRHEPGVRDGVTAFEHDLAILTRDRTINEIRLLLGQGDFVFIAAEGTHHGAPCAYVDLYRIKDGKLVEHWGFPDPIPPRTD